MALQIVINPGTASLMDDPMRMCEKVIWMRHALLSRVDDDIHEEDSWRMELRSGDNTPVLLHLCWDASKRQYNLSTGNDFEWVENVSGLHNAFLYLMQKEKEGAMEQAWDALERMCSGLNMHLPKGVWSELAGEGSSCNPVRYPIREERIQKELQRLAQSRYIGFRDIMLPCPMAKSHEELPLYIRRPCHKASVRLVSCVRVES